MLGFHFSPKPTVNLQVEKLIRKANKRIYLLLNYKRYNLPQDRLKTIYTSSIRSILEYSSNTYHSQINRGLNNQIERIQKKCLKIIYGYNKTYDQLLSQSNLKKMESRREKLFEKFAHKTQKNPKYQHWFPRKEIIRETRKQRPYLEEKASGDRLYRSPIFAMQRLLNNDILVRIDPMDTSGAFNEP